MHSVWFLSLAKSKAVFPNCARTHRGRAEGARGRGVKATAGDTGERRGSRARARHAGGAAAEGAERGVWRGGGAGERAARAATAHPVFEARVGAGLEQQLDAGSLFKQSGLVERRLIDLARARTARRAGRGAVSARVPLSRTAGGREGRARCTGRARGGAGARPFPRRAASPSRARRGPTRRPRGTPARRGRGEGGGGGGRVQWAGRGSAVAATPRGQGSAGRGARARGRAQPRGVRRAHRSGR